MQTYYPPQQACQNLSCEAPVFFTGQQVHGPSEKEMLDGHRSSETGLTSAFLLLLLFFFFFFFLPLIPCSERDTGRLQSRRSATNFFLGALRPQKLYGLLGTREDWYRELEPRDASMLTQLLSSEALVSFFLSWCFTSTETAWLVKDGRKMGKAMRAQAHLPLHTAPEL